MKTKLIKITIPCAIIFAGIIACSSSVQEEQEEIIITDGVLHNAFADFDEDETIIYLSGTNVVIETTGLPNHTTPYWSESHPLYVAPTATTVADMTPTRIDTQQEHIQQI
jgi:hypothetical protein